MVTDRKLSEGEIVSEEGAAGVAAATGGADFTPPTGTAGGKGKKRGKRSRHAPKTERSEVGVQTGGPGLDVSPPTYTCMAPECRRSNSQIRINLESNPTSTG